MYSLICIVLKRGNIHYGGETNTSVKKKKRNLLSKILITYIAVLITKIIFYLSGHVQTRIIQTTHPKILPAITLTTA